MSVLLSHKKWQHTSGEGHATAFADVQASLETAIFGDECCKPNPVLPQCLGRRQKDNEHGIMTVTRCRGLHGFERHNDIEGIKFSMTWTCGLIRIPLTNSILIR